MTKDIFQHVSCQKNAIELVKLSSSFLEDSTGKAFVTFVLRMPSMQLFSLCTMVKQSVIYVFLCVYDLKHFVPGSRMVGVT